MEISEYKVIVKRQIKTNIVACGLQTLAAYGMSVLKTQ